MASKNNKPIFSISEEEETQEEAHEQPVVGIVKGHPIEGTELEPEMQGEGKPSAEIAELEGDSESKETSNGIEHGYEVQARPVSESVPMEEKKPKPKGLLSYLGSIFGGDETVEKVEKEEKPAVEGAHLTDIVQSVGESEQKKRSGGRTTSILGLVVLVALTLLVVYSLIIIGPSEFLERITTLPQRFPQVFEYWFENNIYPVLKPLVGKFVE